MRIATLFALFLASAVQAQPFPEFSVATDKAQYASGEPIGVTVRITNPTEETVRYFFSSGCQFSFVLDGEDMAVGPCTLAMTWTTIDGGLQWEGRATIYPDSTGYPEIAGTHTLTARAALDGFAMTPGPLAPGPVPPAFRLADATTAFSAPAADAGVVSVAYPASGDLADIEAIRAALNADVVRESEFGGLRRESWQVSGAPLDDIVATYENDSRFSYFEIDMEYRAVNVDEGRIVTQVSGLSLVPTGMTAFPNPCRANCGVELRASGLNEPVRVAVYDALGREVAVLHDGPLARGIQRWTLPVEAWTAGFYVVRAEVDGRHFASTRVGLAR